MNETSFSPDQTFPNAPCADSTGPSSTLSIGTFRFDRASGTLVDTDGKHRLEPKVSALLSLLAARRGLVVSRDAIVGALWPDVAVSDEAVAKCVSKLRKALDDDPKTPLYVQTLPKRGYRLIAEVRTVTEGRGYDETPTPLQGARRRRRSGRWITGSHARLAAAVLAGIVVAGSVIVGFTSSGTAIADRPEAGTRSTADASHHAEMLTARGHDFYIQIERASNESAVALYERAIADSPRFAPAHAGLANALVQRVIRWPSDPSLEPLDRPDLASALRTGRTRTQEGSLQLTRALGLAERAVRLAPTNAAAHKALGFVQSALGRTDLAMHSYRRAIDLDADAWDAMINVSDLLAMRGDHAGERQALEQAYEAMLRVYDAQTLRVGPWHAQVGVLIGDRYAEAGHADAAESWFRRVLALAPLDRDATDSLAALLRQGGDPGAADRLCTELAQRTGAACTT